MSKVSTGFKDSTEDYMKMYAAPTLEALAAEAVEPKTILTPEILQALQKLKYELV